MEHKNLALAVLALSTAYCANIPEFSGTIEGKKVELRATSPLESSINIAVQLENGSENYIAVLDEKKMPVLQVYNSNTDKSLKLCLVSVPFPCQKPSDEEKYRLQQRTLDLYKKIQEEQKRPTEED